MNPKELRGLVEAYNQVYDLDELDENRMASRMEKMPSAPAKVGKGTHSIKDLPRLKEPTPEEKAKARKALGLGEAVKGASRHDTEMRKASAAERRGGDKRLSPSKGKANAEKMHRDIKFYDKITKKTKPSVVGMTHEEVEQVDELYKGKHGQSETEYQDSRSNAGKMVSGDSKRSGAAYSYRGVKNTGPNPAGGSQKPQGQGRMTSGQRTELQYRKANLMKKEELDIFDVVLEFLQVEGYAETLEEAEWLMANVIDEEAIDIVIGEAQAARENPEKYEREQAKKSAPVRGERTPMPPRGDKRREDFEKWYAKNVR